MKLADWAGKTVDFAEIKGEYYLVHFTDGTFVKMWAYIRHVEDGWATPYDWAEMEVKYNAP